MATYVILSKILPGTFRDPKDLRRLAESVTARIAQECPGLQWRESFATMGSYDTVDVVESDDPKLVQKAAMIIRAHGHSTTETMLATPWKEFIASL